MQVLRQHPATHRADGCDELGFVAFSLGGAYALDMSITLAQQIAAVVTFYATYLGLDYGKASAANLCHFAEEDPFESAESVAQMEQELRAGRPPSICIRGPSIGSSGRIARSITPRQLAWPGSGPLSSCINSLSKREYSTWRQRATLQTSGSEVNEFSAAEKWWRGRWQWLQESSSVR
jgi:hypothetical protein